MKNVSFFTLYDEKEKASPVNEFLTVKALDNTVEPGKEARFFLASSQKVRVLFEVEQKGGIVSKEFIDLNNEQRIVNIPVTEEDRGNIQVTFSAVVAGRSYLYALPVYVPHTNKRLDVNWNRSATKCCGQQGGMADQGIAPAGRTPNRRIVVGHVRCFVGCVCTYELVPERLEFAPRQIHLVHVGGSYAGSEFLNVYYDDESILMPVYESLNWFGMHYQDWGLYSFRECGATVFLPQVPLRNPCRPLAKQTRNKPIYGLTDKRIPKKTRARGDADESLELSGGFIQVADALAQNTDGRAAADTKADQLQRNGFFFPQIKTDAEEMPCSRLRCPRSAHQMEIYGNGPYQNPANGYGGAGSSDPKRIDDKHLCTPFYA